MRQGYMDYTAICRDENVLRMRDTFKDETDICIIIEYLKRLFMDETDKF